ncbi:hypothetical protein [Streptomyces sp. NPDC007883]|uniref:hypothetical protein n=1 Tax=Streptomyces sp. NPDC007883 TaxID=3155116 RepID=UPI0033F4E2F9
MPDLVGPDGCDLLQVFWCPFEAHGPDRTIEVALTWRRAEDAGTVLTPQPEPPVAGREECVPTPCVVHPEQVVEHQYLGLLDDDLQAQIAEWEETSSTTRTPKTPRTAPTPPRRRATPPTRSTKRPWRTPAPRSRTRSTT